MQLDTFDRKIVAALAAEGRQTAVELAGRVGLSPSACTGCGACIAPCPADAIAMRPKEPAHA